MDVGYQSHDLLPLPRAIAASSPSPSFSSASASTSTSATRAAAAAAAALPPLPFPLFPAVRVSFVHFLRRRVRVSFFADANILDYRENSRIFRPKKVFPCFFSSILINLFFFVLSRRNFFSSKSIITIAYVFGKCEKLIGDIPFFFSLSWRETNLLQELEETERDVNSLGRPSADPEPNSAAT